MREPMQIDGVIFDFNGVLVWDSDLHERAWSDTARAMRGAPLRPEELRDHVHGRPNRDILAYLAGRPLTAAEVAALADEKERRYRALCLEQGAQFRLSPGAAALLGWLAAQSLPRAIATSAGPDNVAFYQTQLALHTWFAPEQIVCDEGDLPGKPAPDIYLRAAARLGLAPQRCAVVEDSRAGVAAARAAGAGRIIALGPPATHAALLALPGVHAAIASLADFPRGLRGLLSLDLLYLVDSTLMIVIYLALYLALRRADESLALIALALVGTAAYFAANPAFEMQALSARYAAATTEAPRGLFVAAGEAMLAGYRGTAFDVYYLFNAVALLIFSWVMWRGAVFSRANAALGFAAGGLMLVSLVGRYDRADLRAALARPVAVLAGRLRPQAAPARAHAPGPSARVDSQAQRKPLEQSFEAPRHRAYGRADAKSATSR